MNGYFWRGLISKVLCTVVLDPESSRMAAFYQECAEAQVSLADTAELWAFSRQARSFWHIIRQGMGLRLMGSGVTGALAIARSDIDQAFMVYDRIDIYNSRTVSLERFGYRDVIEMSEAGVPYAYVDALTKAGVHPDKCGRLYQADIPASYAVAAKSLPVGEVIDAWTAGLPLDYLTAVTG